MIFWLFVYQVAASDVGHALEGLKFDLAKVQPSEDTGDTIVVTGRRRDHRLHDMPETEEPLLPKAEVGLFGKVRAATEVEQESLAGGAVSNRAMVKVKIPF